MAANKKAVQVRIEVGTASKAGHQRAHDMRIGPQPDYVDATRSHLNRVLVEPLTGAELRRVCEARRSQRETRRAMKSNAAVCVSGIITFGHEAQPIFAALSPQQQDAAYREVAARVAARIGTTLSGLVTHGDEAADHAHFQCPGFTLDGQPVSKIAKREALRGIQTIAAEVMAEHAPGIERGKSRWIRIEEGESYADTVHKDSADMRERLPVEKAAYETEIADLKEKLAQTLDRLNKARVLAEGEGQRAEKARKRVETYEARAAKVEAELERVSSQLLAATKELTRIDTQTREQAAEAQRAAEKADEAQRHLESLESRIAPLQAAVRALDRHNSQSAPALRAAEQARDAHIAEQRAWATEWVIKELFVKTYQPNLEVAVLATGEVRSELAQALKQDGYAMPSNVLGILQQITKDLGFNEKLHDLVDQHPVLQEIKHSVSWLLGRLHLGVTKFSRSWNVLRKGKAVSDAEEDIASIVVESIDDAIEDVLEIVLKKNPPPELPDPPAPPHAARPFTDLPKDVQVSVRNALSQDEP